MGFLFNSLFFLVPLIWLPQTSELFEFNKIIATYILAALILGLWVVRCILEKRIIFKRTILDIPLLVFLGISILSLAFSQDVHTSWYGYYSRWNGGLLSLLTYASLYWAYVSNMTRKQTIFSIQCSIFSAVIIAIYGILEHFGRSVSCLLVTGNFDVACWVQDVQNRVYATLGQPNWMAAYLVALIFIPLSKMFNVQYSVSNKNRLNIDHWALIINGLIFILLFLALLFTKSRSGLLAFGISSIVFWIVQFTTPISPSYVGGGRKRVVLFVFWALIVGFFTFIFKNPIRDLIFKPTTVEKTVGTALETGGTESGSIRKIVWKGAVKIWLGSAKNFLLGTGPETFAQSYYQYRPIDHNQTSEWELLYNKAHNEFLNQLATTGLLGLGSYLVLLVFMFSVQYSMINKKLDTGHWTLNIALLGGWLTILVTNFWGFSVVITQLFLFLLPAMSIVISDQLPVTSNQKQNKELNYYQLFGIFGVVLTICYLLYAISSYWRADTLFARGSNAIKSYSATQDPQYIVSAYQSHFESSKANSGEPAILSEFGLSASYLALAMRENATASSQLAYQADKASLEAVGISPFHPNYYKNRARVMIILSELDPKYLEYAKEALLAAQKISPTDPRIPYNLGLITKEKFYFQKALDLKPDFYDAQKQL